MQFPRLTRWTGKLDDGLRHLDLASGRTAGGLLDRCFGIHRHTVWSLVLPCAVCFFAVMASPNWVALRLALGTALLVLLTLVPPMAAFSKKPRALRADLYLQLAVVTVVVAVLWLRAPREYSERLPYQNLLLPLTVAVAVALLIAGLLSESFFRKLRAGSNFEASLSRTELFANRGPVLDITGGDLIRAVAVAPFRFPLQLVLPPAIVALIVRPEWLTFSVFSIFLLCLVAVTLSSLNERFGMMWSLLTHAFLEGGALLISLIVIALGAARCLGVTYVTTIFDTAAGGAVTIVLLSIYALSWWFSYWTSRLLSDQLFRILKPACPSGEVVLEYPIAPESLGTHVPAAGRVVQLHGSSRVIALREKDTPQGITFFHAYDALDLLGAVALSGNPGGRAVPTFLQLKGRAFILHSMATAILAGILIVGVLYNQAGMQDAELATDLDPGGGISAKTLLTQQSPESQILVVAASGGGTRAALFTAAILEGIADRGKAASIVLGSGVSGGGAALAYFAGYRDSLTKLDAAGKYDQAAWKKYFDAMRAPYIQDVLQRASEMRMVRAGRLGMLLRESFSRRWGLADDESRLDICDSSPGLPVCGFGLILNTTLAGRLHLDQKPPAGKTLADVEPDYRRGTSSSLAGGRLVLTNLNLKLGFAGHGPEPDGPGFPIVVRGHAAHLEHAAALNANFPPVFANAAIDTDNQDRYWVTDGGAADNRGMEMLLYTLRDALQQIAAEGLPLPKLHIIVADAGAYSDDFVQDRGVSSALGAGAHFASAIDSDLLMSIEEIYAKSKDRFGYSYVYMPRPLRASGSFGTHWMLQDSITVYQKDQPGTTAESLRSLVNPQLYPHVTISGEEMIEVLRSLYTRQPVRLSPDAQQVLLWARQEETGEQSCAQWQGVLHVLGDDAPLTPPCKKPL